jgi:hypothetical protein
MRHGSQKEIGHDWTNERIERRSGRRVVPASAYPRPTLEPSRSSIRNECNASLHHNRLYVVLVIVWIGRIRINLSKWTLAISRKWV